MRGIDPLNYMLGIAAKLRKHEASAGASAALPRSTTTRRG